MEHFREALASVVVRGDVESESRPLVRAGEVKCELPAAEHDQKVVPSLVDRLQCAADNVQHDGGVDLVHGDRLAAGRIPQTAATDFRHQRLRPGGIPFLGVRGHEDEILSVVPSKLLHLPEHHGQVQHGDNAGGIAVRSRIEIPVDDPVAVIVGGDDHILVLPGGVFSRQETDDIPSHRAAAPFIIIFQCGATVRSVRSARCARCARSVRSAHSARSVHSVRSALRRESERAAPTAVERHQADAGVMP